MSKNLLAATSKDIDRPLWQDAMGRLSVEDANLIYLDLAAGGTAYIKTMPDNSAVRLSPNAPVSTGNNKRFVFVGSLKFLNE